MNSLDLPNFETIDELSELIGLSSRLLYCLSMKSSRYYTFKNIPKRNGSLREISIPSYTLHIVQRWILHEILNKITPSTRAMAYRKGRGFGHKQNAFYHAHTLYGLSVDLKDFFPCILSNKVYTLFANIGYNSFAATVLTNLCTLNGKLPQGSACSPAISNLVCISLDKRLIGLCEKRGIRFTRYADDMYFSCDNKVILLKTFPIIQKIIEDDGFVINIKKVHFHTPSNKKIITGVTVVSYAKEDIIKLKAPRDFKRKIRTEIFQSITSGNYSNMGHILGEIAYVDYIEKENGAAYLARVKKYIRDVGQKIQYFPELVKEYNSNLFFVDLEILKYYDIQKIQRTEEYENFEDTYKKRREYILKHGIEDICDYKNWPEHIIFSE
jgi:retron-type reverse transcriptase